MSIRSRASTHRPCDGRCRSRSNAAVLKAGSLDGATVGWLLLGLVLALAFRPAAAAGEAISDDELEKVLAAEQSRVEVVEQVYDTVVSIYGNNRQGGGSGVLIDSDGFALTNFHVVQAAGSSGWAGLADGELYRWTLYGIDPGGDLAMIRLEGRDSFPYAQMGDSDLVRMGDWVMAMGNPFALAEDQRPTVTLGIVSGVNRFQPGTGPTGRMLVYGDCIQIDSSINPGNSGGPLFNMKGQVIGINGRGSFEERGRVNVGVGYAISIEQAKNFIPDLLATRTSMHGTLDAVFSDRDAGVVCTSINTGSPIARAGMQPGDRLISFEGRRIRSANQFASLITLYPAHWPVHVVWQREGRRHEATVRLTPLPFAPQRGEGPRSQPQPEPDQPAEAAPVEAPRAEPGEIRDREIAAEQGRRIFEQWMAWRDQQAGGSPPRNKQLTGSETIVDEGRERGTQRIVWRPGGAIEVLERQGMSERAAGVVGRLEDELGQARHALLRDVDDYDKLILKGSDKAAGERAYRVLAKTDAGEYILLYFSVMAPDNLTMQARLLKAAPADEDGTPGDAALRFEDYQAVDGHRLPHTRRIVRGVDEREDMAFALDGPTWAEATQPDADTDETGNKDAEGAEDAAGAHAPDSADEEAEDEAA